MEIYPYNEQYEKTRKWCFGCYIAFVADFVLGPFVIWLLLSLYGIEVRWKAFIPDQLSYEIARTQIKGFFCVVVIFVTILVLSFLIGVYKAVELGRLEKRLKLLSNPEIQSVRTRNPDSAPTSETTPHLGPAPEPEIITQPDSSTPSETTPQPDSALQPEASTQPDSTTPPETTPQPDSASQSETSTQPEIAKQPMDSRDIPSGLDTQNNNNSINVNDNEKAVPRNPNAHSERTINGNKEGQVDNDPDPDVLSRQDVDKMLRVLSGFKQKYIYGFAYYWLLQNGNLPGASQAAFCRFLAYNHVDISPGTISNEAGNAEIIVQTGNPEETKKKLSTKDNPNNSLVKVRDYKLMSEKLQAFIPKNKTIDISVPKNQGTIIKDC